MSAIPAYARAVAGGLCKDVASERRRAAARSPRAVPHGCPSDHDTPLTAVMFGRRTDDTHGSSCSGAVAALIIARFIPPTGTCGGSSAAGHAPDLIDTVRGAAAAR